MRWDTKQREKCRDKIPFKFSWVRKGVYVRVTSRQMSCDKFSYAAHFYNPLRDALCVREKSSFNKNLKIYAINFPRALQLLYDWAKHKIRIICKWASLFIHQVVPSAAFPFRWICVYHSLSLALFLSLSWPSHLAQRPFEKCSSFNISIEIETFHLIPDVCFNFLFSTLFTALCLICFVLQCNTSLRHICNKVFLSRIAIQRHWNMCVRGRTFFTSAPSGHDLKLN